MMRSLFAEAVEEHIALADSQQIGLMQAGAQAREAARRAPREDAEREGRLAPPQQRGQRERAEPR